VDALGSDMMLVAMSWKAGALRRDKKRITLATWDHGARANSTVVVRADDAIR